MTILNTNLTALRSHYPDLAARIDAYSDKDNVCIFQAKDGGTGYGLRQNGKMFPLTDPVSPLTRIQSQLEQNSTRLMDFTKQVLIVGLCPGDELLYIFDLAKKNTIPHAQQQIFVCIDSLACLYGFLQTFDAKRVIESNRTHFFWHENTEKQVNELRNRPEYPATFTLISCATNDILDRVMPHFVQLIQERKAETDRLMKENNAYYNSLTDEQLAKIIAQGSNEVSGAGTETAKAKVQEEKDSRFTIHDSRASIARAPRLMMATCAWSTVVQYSSRDTCAAFQAIGWDVRHLNMDSMLTPYYLAKQINEFKPDVFIFINHLRTEATDAYPENMMFLTWIQDPNPLINKKESAQEWNKVASVLAPQATAPQSAIRRRDLIIGYVGQLKKYGYLEDRLYPISMIVNTETFKPRELTTEQREKYECDICFASNAGRTTEIILKEDVAAALTEYHFSEDLLFAIHDHLWECYRAGETFTNYKELETELCKLDNFKDLYATLSEQDRDQAIQTLFGRMNDAIYRHVVLEWCDGLGLDLHLYGLGWDKHPRFAKYAQGEIEHGQELSIAYQAAKYCLHLNSSEGGHQRLWEILASGATPLIRCTRNQLARQHMASALRKLTQPVSGDSLQPDNEAFTNWLFSTAARLYKTQQDNKTPMKDQVLNALHQYLLTNTDWLISNWSESIFSTKEDLKKIF